MKYRVIKQGDDEITVITEDGGVACIREVDEIEEGDGRVAVTDYYQSRFDNKMLEEEDIWEILSEGKIYCEDWTTPFDNPEHIQDALTWLWMCCDKFEVDESIWENF